MKKAILLIIILFILSFSTQLAIGVDNDGSEISSGETLTGLINPKIDTDTFTFSATAGQYKIVVMDRGTNDIGNYSFSILLNPWAISSGADSDGTNAIPDEIYTGKIDYKSDIDAFTFSASAGQNAIITITTESDSLNPAMYIYSPNGSRETEAIATFSTATLMDHTIQNTGQYKMVIMDKGANDIGEYSFTITLIDSGTSDPSDPTQDDTIMDDDDEDNDGFTDYIENAVGTDPEDPNSKPSDSDNDGLPDLIDDDNDNDGYTNYEENNEGTNPLDKTDYPENIGQLDTDGDESTNNVDDDDDNDGYTDVQELLEGTNPVDTSSYPGNVDKTDIDEDGVVDSEDTDDDNDGMPDHWELFYGFNPLSVVDSLEDTDVDKYTNLDEFKGGSNPRDKDDYPD